MAEKKTVKKTVEKTVDYKARVLAEIEKLQKDSLYHSSAVKEILERILKDGTEKKNFYL